MFLDRTAVLCRAVRISHRRQRAVTASDKVCTKERRIVGGFGTPGFFGFRGLEMTGQIEPSAKDHGS